ncbi:MAG: YdcF family protein [Roseivirga sp.]|nr:YdcF family protein [Roseivirga sp.]
MFFILSKILAFFVRPLVWIIFCFLGSYFFKKPRLKKRLFWAGTFMLVLFSNQYISNRVMLLWEPAPVLIKTLAPHDVAIVFTGVSKGSKEPADRVYFNMDADRITHTLQLYNAGKIKHILISGGLGFKQKSSNPAAERLRSFLLMAGVPDIDITVESEAVNTYENAVNSARILKEHYPNQKYLLITSAFHMKRSSLCLKAQGISFNTFPAGFRTDRPTAKFDDLFIPRSSAIDRWEIIIKEIAGIATYKVMGYL